VGHVGQTCTREVRQPGAVVVAPDGEREGVRKERLGHPATVPERGPRAAVGSWAGASPQRSVGGPRAVLTGCHDPLTFRTGTRCRGADVPCRPMHEGGQRACPGLEAGSRISCALSVAAWCWSSGACRCRRLLGSRWTGWLWGSTPRATSSSDRRGRFVGSEPVRTGSEARRQDPARSLEVGPSLPCT